MDSVGTLTGLSMEAMVTRLREAALYAHLHRITPENLTTDHLNIFHRALLRTLGSELAIDKYAQIIDGLPIADVAWDKRHRGILGDDHPIEAHVTLCPGVKDKTRTFLEQYDLRSLVFDPDVVQAYRNAALGSKAFHTRLIELVVVSLHQVAVDLFIRDGLRSHSQQEIDAVTSCVMAPPKSPAGAAGGFVVEFPPRPTLFNHPFYVDLDINPEGIADIVGYWAEDLTIGGIVLFDRRADPRDAHADEDQPTGEDPPNVWLHPARDHVTDRIFQLREDQQEALVGYLAAPGDTSKPLPILPDKHNRTRIDPSIANSHNFIFRDYWDRKPATQ